MCHSLISALIPQPLRPVPIASSIGIGTNGRSAHTGDSSRARPLQPQRNSSAGGRPAPAGNSSSASRPAQSGNSSSGHPASAPAGNSSSVSRPAQSGNSSSGHPASAPAGDSSSGRSSPAHNSSSASRPASSGNSNAGRPVSSGNPNAGRPASPGSNSLSDHPASPSSNSPSDRPAPAVGNSTNREPPADGVRIIRGVYFTEASDVELLAPDNEFNDIEGDLYDYRDGQSNANTVPALVQPPTNEPDGQGRPRPSGSPFPTPTSPSPSPSTSRPQSESNIPQFPQLPPDTIVEGKFFTHSTGGTFAGEFNAVKGSMVKTRLSSGNQTGNESPIWPDIKPRMTPNKEQTPGTDTLPLPHGGTHIKGTFFTASVGPKFKTASTFNAVEGNAYKTIIYNDNQLRNTAKEAATSSANEEIEYSTHSITWKYKLKSDKRRTLA
ncbi:hypothetical protein F5880DRAFT_1511951 [Lentinula raphanica]|nr:hypothetical protein F5880DRAFT_1511951 [Lentinula raphanica]